MHLSFLSPQGHYYFMLVMPLGAVSLGVHIRRKCVRFYICVSVFTEEDEVDSLED